MANPQEVLAQSTTAIDAAAARCSQEFAAQALELREPFAQETQTFKSSNPEVNALEAHLSQGDNVLQQIGTNLEATEATVDRQKEQLKQIADKNQEQNQAEQNTESNSSKSTTDVPKPRPPEGGEG